jgi:hypothetical protein
LYDGFTGTTSDSENFDKYNEHYTKVIAEAVGDCIGCKAECIAKVVGVSFVQDQAVTRTLEKIAKVTANGAVKNAIPIYNVYSNSSTTWGVIECVTNCR